VRAALYLRVSTKRQAEQDLSIPDQRKQLEAYCRQRGWTVGEEYVEAGASGTSDNRPEFQNMISAARQKPRAFDVVLVHSFSRFARDSVDLELYVRDFRKLGIRLQSTTQETNDDPMGDMMRKMVSIFDEHQSRENAKHTSRAMKENARQGFWNGGHPPFGYRIVDAEKRGDKMKRRLDVEPKEAELVRQMFRLYVNGDGTTAPIGVKAIATYLNARGYKQRRGRLFNNKFVQECLREHAYVGTYYFNRVNTRAREARPENEWVAMACPTILDVAVFDAAQGLLDRRNPRKTPGRGVKNPILLSGMVKCAHCRSTMSLRTGKGGKYRYYACLKQAKEGKSGCKGCSVPMPALDSAVTEALCNQVLTPERLSATLQELCSALSKDRETRPLERAALTRKMREAEAKIDRLYDALERGTVEQDDVFKRRVSASKAERDEIIRIIAQSERRATLPQSVITPKKLAAFSQGLGDMLRNGDIQFRKAYLRLLVGKVEIMDGEIRLSGSSNALLAAANAGLPGRSGGVPTLVHEWRAVGDSNFSRRRLVSRFLKRSVAPPYSAPTISSVIFFASPSSIMVLSR
jgi:DNA invertase Pin-like site-specific DNA recombinase